MIPAMRAAIVAVGSELLGTDRLDTNSLRLTEILERHGVELRRRWWWGTTGGRSRRDAAPARLADLVLVTGGLGPTADDVTREAAADALGRTLTLDDGDRRWLEERFRAFGREMPAVNRRQAMVPDGASRCWPTRRGAGCLARLRRRAVRGRGTPLFLFPGVPKELEGMIDDDFEPWLAERSGGERRERGVLKTAGLPESDGGGADRPGLRGVRARGDHRPGGRRGGPVRGVAGGTDAERAARLAAIEARLAELLGEAVYARRGESTWSAVAGAADRARPDPGHRGVVYRRPAGRAADPRCPDRAPSSWGAW